MLDCLFEELQHQQLERICIDAVNLDRTIVEAHPDGTGARRQKAYSPSGDLAEARTALTFSLTPGQAGDAPAGGDLLLQPASLPKRSRIIMDRAYGGNGIRQLVVDLGLRPVTPPVSERVEPWRYSKAWHRRRNQI